MSVGKAAIKALLSPAYAKLKNVPAPPPSKEAAREYLHSLIPYTFFLRVQVGPTISPGTKAIQINPQQLYQPDEYYVWLIEPNPIKQLVLAATMVLVVLAGVMFPLWPVKMRVGVWYLSVGVLGLIAAFFGLAIVRLILWVLTKLALSPGIWLFPNLFADVGFVSRALLLEQGCFTHGSMNAQQVDSFIPLWSWDLPPTKKSKSSSSKKSTSEGGSKKKSSGGKKRKDASGAAPSKAGADVDVHQAAGVEDDDEPGAGAPEEVSEGAKIMEMTRDRDEDSDDE